jgi:glycosyltransferase involved in cell wall biosynthesis
MSSPEPKVASGESRDVAAPARRLRILMLLQNNPYPQDVRVRQEAESLAAAGHQVEVLAPNGGDQLRKEEIAGVRVSRFWLPDSSGSAIGFVIEYAVAHLQLFARGVAGLLRGAEVVHLHNPPDTLFPVGLVARGLGRRVVFDHHDLFAELLEEKLSIPLLPSVARGAQAASIRTANAVLVTNRSQAEAVLDNGLRDARRLSVVRNGPKRASRGERRPARQGVLEEPHLVFVGELDSQDGILLLPELLRQPGLEQARLTIVGDGALREELARCVDAARMSHRVVFTGHVPHEQVAGLIASADICIDPAPCNELNHRSTMIKVTEYLACGRPVVAFELRETVYTAGDAALYAPCGDLPKFASLIVDLARDPQLRAELSAAAAERSTELVWEHSEKELIGAYGRL